MNVALKGKLEAYRARVESGIDQLLPVAETRPAKLHAAMRYSMEVGGKRIRPALLFAASDLFASEASQRRAMIGRLAAEAEAC